MLVRNTFATFLLQPIQIYEHIFAKGLFLFFFSTEVQISLQYKILLTELKNDILS